jgi:hypothetical protein
MLSREKEWIKRRRSSHGSEKAGETKERALGSANKLTVYESTDIMPSTPSATYASPISNAHITPFDRLDPAKLRIFTGEEKKIEGWTYAQILPARDWFYQNRSDNEAFNKTLMLRLIRIDKQAGMQAAVNAYFAKIED